MIEIVRFCDSEMGTFGRLYMPEFSCFTVERPWISNEPFISCIPVGTYDLVPSRYHRGGYDTYEIADVPGRSRILIHKGNTMAHVQGCVAIGMLLGFVDGLWAVLHSAQAFRAFKETTLFGWETAPSPVKLTIRWKHATPGDDA